MRRTHSSFLFNNPLPFLFVPLFSLFSFSYFSTKISFPFNDDKIVFLFYLSLVVLVVHLKLLTHFYLSIRKTLGVTVFPSHRHGHGVTLGSEDPGVSHRKRETEVREED